MIPEISVYANIINNTSEIAKAVHVETVWQFTVDAIKEVIQAVAWAQATASVLHVTLNRSRTSILRVIS